MAKFHSVHMVVVFFQNHPDDNSEGAHIDENSPIQLERTFHSPQELISGVQDLATQFSEVWTETDEGVVT